MFCDQCGARVTSDSRFCIECGNKLQPREKSFIPLTNRVRSSQMQIEQYGDGAIWKKVGIGIFVVFVIVVGYIGLKLYMARIADRKLQELIADVSDVVDIRYDKVSVDLFGFDAHVKGIVIRDPGRNKAAKIEEAVIYDYDESNEIPHFLEVTLNGVNIQVSQSIFGNDTEDIKKLGYDEFILTIDLSYRYKPDESKFDLNHFRVKGNDMGALSISFSIENIYPNDNFLDYIRESHFLMITSAMLKYKDSSLLKRWIKWATGGETIYKNMSEAEVIDLVFGSAINQEIEAARMNGNKFTADSLEEVLEFVKTRNQISIVFRPKEPVPVGTVISIINEYSLVASELIELLNVKVESN